MRLCEREIRKIRRLVVGKEKEEKRDNIVIKGLEIENRVMNERIYKGGIGDRGKG